MKTVQISLNIRMDISVPECWSNDDIEYLIQEMDYELRPIPIDNEDNIELLHTEINGFEILNNDTN